MAGTISQTPAGKTISHPFERRHRNPSIELADIDAAAGVIHVPRALIEDYAGINLAIEHLEEEELASFNAALEVARELYAVALYRMETAENLLNDLFPPVEEEIIDENLTLEETGEDTVGEIIPGTIEHTEQDPPVLEINEMDSSGNGHFEHVETGADSEELLEEDLDPSRRDEPAPEELEEQGASDDDDDAGNTAEADPAAIMAAFQAAAALEASE
jgi:hypothetical protein